MKISTEYRVCYCDTDQMGITWHGNYIRIFEVAREEFLRALGYTHKAMEEDGVMTPLVDLDVKYLRPSYYDEVLRIETTVSPRLGARMRFDFEIFNPAGELITTGHTTLGFINATTRRPCKPPQRIREIFAAYSK